MSRYIDIEPILEWCDNPEVFEPYGVNSVELERKIRQAPSIDIVTCYMCKYSHMTYDGQCKYCDNITDDDGNVVEVYFDADHYCSDGEREGE